MKASELITHLQNIVKKHGDLELITAKDDEGNGYNPVYFMPSVGQWNDSEGEFRHEDDLDDPQDINIICI